MKLYVASTSSFAGKTLVALALAKLWAREGVAVGYVKPLGKIPVAEGGKIVDEDAAFLAGELGLPGPPEAVCPVVITQDLVMAAYRGTPLRLKERVLRAASEAASRTGVLLPVRPTSETDVPRVRPVPDFRTDCRVFS
jgi:BioD-like phosphotransacetylase family protein